MLDAERDQRGFFRRKLDGREARSRRHDTERRDGTFREQPANRRTTNVRRHDLPLDSDYRVYTR